MKLYTKTGCPWCVDAVDYLKRHGYRFQEIDVRVDPVAFQEMQNVSGQTKAPTLVLDDGKVLPDFDVDQLRAFFAEHGVKPS